MIKITEIPSVKVVGETSLRLDFEYNLDIINIIKEAEDCIWHKKLYFWEAPVSKLGFLIDNLTYIDNIDLRLLPDKDHYNYNLILNYKSTPFDYQLEGIKWLLDNPNCLLLDPPGLGKSIQTIYLAEELKAQENYEHCLIITERKKYKNIQTNNVS